MMEMSKTVVLNPSLAATTRRRSIALHVTRQLCYAGLDTSYARLNSCWDVSLVTNTVMLGLGGLTLFTARVVILIRGLAISPTALLLALSGMAVRCIPPNCSPPVLHRYSW